MRAKVVVGLLMVGGCSESAFNSTQQQVADPAPVLSITSAVFHGAVGGTNVSYCSPSGPTCAVNPPTQVRWGQPVDNINQSGLGFADAGAHTISYGTSFPIGVLSHFNFPTNGGTSSSAVSLDLQIRVDPSVPGPALFDAPITIPFAIDETPNEAPCPYPSATPCSDKITFGTSTFALNSTSSSTVYDLSILGFVDATTLATVPGLISEENGTSSAVLQAVLNEHCVDTDSDGVCDEQDNCVTTANADQADSDGDGQGDACDACPLDPQNDVDGDGVCGNVDNCPATANADQADTDHDGIGDACDSDNDNDGVDDPQDQCPGTTDAPVDENGCSVSQLCPCAGPWPNHGQYVSCVAHATTHFVNAGLMTAQQRSVLVSTAGQSSCGK
jgi:hypothetical protein